MRRYSLRNRHFSGLWRPVCLTLPLLASLAGCAANSRQVDESFLKQVEKDPFPSASSKGLAAN